jgi:hypothetical protein
MNQINEYSSASRVPWSVDRLWFSSAAPLAPPSAEKTPLLDFRLLGFWRAIGENQYRVSNMVSTPKPPREEVVQSGSTSINEVKLLNDVVHARVQFPQDVLRVEFRFGEDSTGAPAVWIVLVAHDDLKPSKRKIASLQRAAEEARSVVHRESDRWPYVEIATE